MYTLVAATVARSLGQICDVLDDLPPSPRQRELSARARAYAELLDSWPRTLPTDAQQEALLDCVMTLHAEVVRSSGTYIVSGILDASERDDAAPRVERTASSA